MGKATNNSALSAFDKMAEKVNLEEARAAAYQELDADSVEDKFKKLEEESRDSEVDEELAAIKAKLGK